MTLRHFAAPAGERNIARAAASNRGSADMYAHPRLHGLLWATLLGGLAHAQQAKVLHLKDLPELLKSRGHEVPGGVAPIERLARHMTTWFATEGRAPAAADQPADPPARRVRRPTIRAIDEEGLIFVSGLPEHIALVQSVVDELRRDVVRELRLQCTLVRLPKAVAIAHGLAIGGATPIDEATAGKVQKEAVRALGSLKNLPEVKVAPFVPFRIEQLADDRKPIATSAPLRVRGESVLVSGDEALFAVQIVACPLPDDPTVLPLPPLIDGSFAFRLKSGAGVMLLPASVGGAADTKDVVGAWLRLIEIAQPAPQPEPQPRAAPPKPDDRK